jgi:S-adenosylmethionine:tRNA ribosyltransferase-isomerase
MCLKGEENTEHLLFSALPDRLVAGDLLIRNTARVIPAYLEGHKANTGGRVDLLFLAPSSGKLSDQGPTQFWAMGRSSKPIRIGGEIILSNSEILRVIDRNDSGHLELATQTSRSLESLLHEIGGMPIPPYIRQARAHRGETIHDESDRARYQTVYAADSGAVAAPTAGLHFTQSVCTQLCEKGVQFVDICLNIGVGTFKPLEHPTLEEHNLHTESYTISPDSAQAINRALVNKNRIICVGTTSLRVLEDQARRGDTVSSGSFETDIFIHPGIPIRWADGLITNFHLPRSSLLTLVCAFSGYDQIMHAYRTAVERGYRFYSYGDAMLLWRNL